MPGPDPWYEPLTKALRAAAFVASHVLAASVLIAAITSVKWVVHLFGDLKLFDWVPLGYVFDAMDACVLVVFFVFGVIDAVSVFRG